MPQHISACIHIVGHLIHYYSTPLYSPSSHFIITFLTNQLVYPHLFFHSGLNLLCKLCLFLCVCVLYPSEYCCGKHILCVTLAKLRLTDYIFSAQGIKVNVNQFNQKAKSQMFVPATAFSDHKIYATGSL